MKEFKEGDLVIYDNGSGVDPKWEKFVVKVIRIYDVFGNTIFDYKVVKASDKLQAEKTFHIGYEGSGFGAKYFELYKESKFKKGDIVIYNKNDNITIVMVDRVIDNENFAGMIIRTNSPSVQAGHYKETFKLDSYDLCNAKLKLELL